MATNNERFPPPPSGPNFGDDADSRRLHPTLSNSIPDDGRSQRSRESSRSQPYPYPLEHSRYQQARQPINDAVKSAFNSTDATTTASFSPELLQQITTQITANVLQQLKATNLSLAAHPAQMAGIPADAGSSTAGSPPLDRAAVYTPPSPYRPSDENGGSHPSPQFPPPSSQSSFRATSPSIDKRAVSPLSQPGHFSEGETGQSRPRGPRRMSTGGDATILERVWGNLFTEQGQATPRLGQFLRGIAVHLIEDYEPKHSLVITPAKMQRYYEATKLANELYPWKIIFDDRTSSISRMFREIEAQHHLVQDKLSERPDIPGLTPQGFATWMELMLKAHPDLEYDRLAKTALDMPISNPDEKKERFPKELSRRLFPNEGDTETAYKLQKAMTTHCNVNFASRQSSAAETNPRAAQSSVSHNDSAGNATLRSTADKQDTAQSTSQPSPAISHASLERQRQPYVGPAADVVDGEDAEDAGDDVPTPQPIERERKPYVAAPGVGKTYDNIDKAIPPTTAIPAAASTTEPKPATILQEPKLGRSNSVNNTSRASESSRPNIAPIAIHQRPPPPPMEMPEARHHRSNSTYHRDPPRRNRSPSTTKENSGSSYIRRSESEAPFASPPHQPDPLEDARRYRDYEAHRERLANDRYDAARMSAYDPRERERERDRENRSRMASNSVSGLGFDVPLTTRERNTAPYSTSVPAGDEEYYLNRANTATSASHGGGHSTPSSISTGFHPPPAPPPVSMAREHSSGMSRDSAYGSFPTSAGYPPNSYRDVR